MNDINVWITYHDNKQIEEYSLKETEEYKLFKANDTDIKGASINYLNKFYSEICTLYWVYKNKKKSRMVGFCHYRRMLIDWLDLDNGECITFPPVYMPTTIYNFYKEAHNMFDMIDAIDIINEQYGEENKYTKYLLNERVFIGNCCFIMNYGDFEKLCEFLFPILEEFDRRNNLNMNFDNYMAKAKRDFRYEKVDYQCRAVAFLSERLISCYIYTNMNAISITRTGKTVE
jgi:hypothetical protein